MTADETITDPVRLRALAHPLRWKLIDFVQSAGTATVTQCAESLNESVASCWYHLRILAKYGYVEQVLGTAGREKPWRRTSDRLSLGVVEGDSESKVAQGAAGVVFLEHEFTKLADRFRARTSEPKAWREASAMESTSLTLTAAELKAAMAEIVALMRQIADQYADRSDPTKVPEGAREVGLFFVGSVAPKQQIP